MLVLIVYVVALVQLARLQVGASATQPPALTACSLSTTPTLLPVLSHTFLAQLSDAPADVLAAWSTWVEVWLEWNDELAERLGAGQ